MAVIDGEITITTLDGSKSITFAPVGGMKYTTESLASADSGRDDGGMMHIDFILTRTRKINIVLPPITGTAKNEILDMVQGRIYKIKFRDSITNDEKEITVYTSNSSASLYSGTISGGIWTDVAFNAIEMGGETT